MMYQALFKPLCVSTVCHENMLFVIHLFVIHLWSDTFSVLI